MSSSNSPSDRDSPTSTLPVRRSPKQRSSSHEATPGPSGPRLQFLTSSHPDEMKSKAHRRIVKQHAMLDSQQRRRETNARMNANTAKKRSPTVVSEGFLPVPETVRPRAIMPTPSAYSTDAEVSESDVAKSKETFALVMQRYAGFSSVDPFKSLPQFESHIPIERLQYLNQAYFPFLKRSPQYVNALISSPLVFLADAHPGIVLQDALDGRPQGSNMTLAAKAEIYTMINKKLRDPNPAVRLGRDVIAGVFNLILLELAYDRLDVINAHLRGFRAIMDHIGGFKNLGFDPNLAVMAVFQGLETAIYFEVPADPFYLTMSPVLQERYADIAAKVSKWESPVNSGEFTLIAESKECSLATLWMLKNMKRFTRHVLNQMYRAEPAANLTGREMIAISQKLLSLPSADQPGNPNYHDFVYESVRISSIIYATAILRRVPFSVAAASDATKAPGLSDPIQALVRAFKKTNHEGCWGPMVGTFMWVCKIGCAATPGNNVCFKWLYLEVARAGVMALRNRQYSDLLRMDETVLRIQGYLRSSENALESP